MNRSFSKRWKLIIKNAFEIQTCPWIMYADLPSFSVASLLTAHQANSQFFVCTSCHCPTQEWWWWWESELIQTSLHHTYVVFLQTFPGVHIFARKWTLLSTTTVSHSSMFSTCIIVTSQLVVASKWGMILRLLTCAWIVCSYVMIWMSNVMPRVSGDESTTQTGSYI